MFYLIVEFFCEIIEEFFYKNNYIYYIIDVVDFFMFFILCFNVLFGDILLCI